MTIQVTLKTHQEYAYNREVNMIMYPNYFIFNQDYIDITPTFQSAIVLQRLVGISKLLRKVSREFNGWFFYTVEMFEKDLRMKQNAQSRILSRLEEEKLIETERRGMPPTRCIKVNFKVISIALYEAKERYQEEE